VNNTFEKGEITVNGLPVPELKPYDRATDSPMKRETAMQMWCGMILANLFNSSSGRNFKHSAATAYLAAEAMWDEWVRRGNK
jgi:hypothetical protein